MTGQLLKLNVYLSDFVPAFIIGLQRGKPTMKLEMMQKLNTGTNLQRNTIAMKIAIAISADDNIEDEFN